MPTETLNRTRRRLAGGLAVLAVRNARPDALSLPTFPLFDALGHRGKPNLLRAGLRPLTWVGNLWRTGIAHDGLDHEGVVLALKQLPRGTEAFYIDVETWPILRQPALVRERSIRQLLQVADLARAHVPGAKFGFYGLPPAITYWPLVGGRTAEYSDWIESNQRLEPLAERVDYIFPSLYTFYADRPGWLAYADATIKAARRFGKPVYPFLWFEYHDSNFSLRHHEVDLDAWTEELQFCHSNADGLVLWGGWESPWKERAAWWQSVRREFRLSA
jgi:hypothetical protein